MNLLIIGSQGFIGSNCFRFFTEKFPSWKIWCCDINSSNLPEYFQVSPEKPDYTVVFSSVPFDICINASGSGSVSFSIENPEKDYELNVRNVQRMLEAIRQCNPACKFINFSSAAVYGNPVRLPVKESDPVNPISPYGRHKLESEKILMHYYKEYNIPTCSLRVFSAYGPGLRKQIFWDIYQQTIRSKAISLFGTGTETRDFIYIDDLVRAVQCIIEKYPFKGEAVNASTGIQVSIKDAAILFGSFLNRKLKIEFTGEKHEGAPLKWWADITTLKSFGFCPQVSINEGLMKVAAIVKTLSL